MQYSPFFLGKSSPLRLKLPLSLQKTLFRSLGGERGAPVRTVFDGPPVVRGTFFVPGGRSGGKDGPGTDTTGWGRQDGSGAGRMARTSWDGKKGRGAGSSDSVRFLRLTGLKYMQKATRAGGLLCSWGCRSRAGPLRGIFYRPFSCIRQTRSQTRLE